MVTTRPSPASRSWPRLWPWHGGLSGEARSTVAAVLKGLAEGPNSPIDRVLTGDEAQAAGGFPGAAFVVGVKPDTRIGGSMDGGAIVRPG